MNEEQGRQLKELVEFKKNLENSFSIPFSVERAFRERLRQPFFASKNLDFGSVANNGSEVLTIEVPGVEDGDPVVLGIPNAAENAGVFYTAWVTSPGIVSIRFNNESGGTLDKGAGIFEVAVFKTVPKK